jgi:hypothetical protein
MDSRKYTVITGGGSGAGKGATRAAFDMGHITRGIVPKGYRTEDTLGGKEFAEKYGLEQHPTSSKFSDRDIANTALLLQTEGEVDPRLPALHIGFLIFDTKTRMLPPNTGAGTLKSMNYTCRGEYSVPDHFARPSLDISAPLETGCIKGEFSTTSNAIVLRVFVPDEEFGSLLARDSQMAGYVRKFVGLSNGRIMVSGATEHSFPGIEEAVYQFMKHILV